MHIPRRRPSSIVATVLFLAAVAGCASSETTTNVSNAPAETTATSASRTTVPGSSSAPASAASFPMTVTSCGRPVTFDESPKKVLLVGSYDATLLATVGALDRVTARVGNFPVDLFDEATRAAVERIPPIGGTKRSGAPDVSLKVILDQAPDLVIGFESPDSGVTVEALADAGIPLLVIPSFCKDPSQVPAKPGFDDIADRIELYGRLFAENPSTVAAAVDSLRTRVAAVSDVARAGPQRSAATIFGFPDGTPPSAYGARSISHAVIEAAGFTDVFGDVDKRVFETSAEAIIGANPDVIVLLYRDSDPAAVKQAFLALPGADALTAVKNDDILMQEFDQWTTPNLLVVDGLENFATAFVKK